MSRDIWWSGFCFLELDTEDLYTNIKNDVPLYTYLIDRVKNSCDKYDIKLLELYGVVFNG